MRPGQLKRDCQLLCKNHSQATQYPALDCCVSILVLEKLDKDPKHCSFTRVTNQNSARAISSYMVKVSLKECQSLKLQQHSQSQTNVDVWVLIALQVVLLSNPQRVLPQRDLVLQNLDHPLQHAAFAARRDAGGLRQHIGERVL